MTVRELEPSGLWNKFADLNEVPRPSKHEERVIEFMIKFGNDLGLETIKDRIGNVIIKKHASHGYEDRKTIILQSHLDMVHQKNGDTIFDFNTEGIRMRVNNDWVDAEGTTLGADNGIGVAAIMALLESDTISHPPLEALFTIDEETGMTGAIELDGTLLSGDILLNLDTEDDDELSIGCAGGVDTNTSYSYSQVEAESNDICFQITVKGLLGGHSGMDIDSGRGNANKIMNRILLHLNTNNLIKLVSIDGGSLRNAIPRESVGVVAVSKDNKEEFEKEFAIISNIIKVELSTIETEMIITSTDIEGDFKTVNPIDAVKIINSISSVHNGVYRMSPDIEGLVETSSSLARVIVSGGVFTTQSLQRSSVESTKADVANSIRASFEASGCEVVQGGDYPGWQPNANSEILTLMSKMYKDKFLEGPKVKACHAGLECGILLKHLPDVDMISFGPNIRAAHSPDEKVQISSVQKFWDFLLDVLKEIPLK